MTTIPGARLPVSGEWLRQLDELGATNPLKGLLLDYSTKIDHPFWCRQLVNFASDSDLADMDIVKPLVKQQRLGNKPNSPKLVAHMYNTAAWSTWPCTCQYRYEGWTTQTIGVIGESHPPLCRQDRSTQTLTQNLQPPTKPSPKTCIIKPRRRRLRGKVSMLSNGFTTRSPKS